MDTYTDCAIHIIKNTILDSQQRTLQTCLHNNTTIFRNKPNTIKFPHSYFVVAEPGFARGAGGVAGGIWEVAGEVGPFKWEAARLCTCPEVVGLTCFHNDGATAGVQVI